MKATWEKTENSRGVLTVEVDEAQVAAALDKAFRKVVRNVTVPGFRKGKVPRPIFEARFGVEVLYQDAADILLRETYPEAVEQTGIEPVAPPDIDIEQIGKDKPFIYKATVVVKPDVKLGEYKGLEIPAKSFAVTDEDVEARLKELQEKNAVLEAVEDRAAENGDVVTIDFEGFLNGEPFEGGKAEKYVVELGSGTLIAGFEEQVVGMKPGEEKEIAVTFPEDYHNADLAGKSATFKVKLHEVKRKNLPALDDEFAKDVSEFETLEELKADLRKQLEEKARNDEEQYKRDTVVEKAAENAEVEIPDVMIEREIDNLVRDFDFQLRLMGLTLDRYLTMMRLTPDKLREQFKENATKRVRAYLVLEAIAKAENITVTDDDIEKEIAAIAERYEQPVEQVKKVYEDSSRLETLKDELLIRKTIDFLVANSRTVA